MERYIYSNYWLGGLLGVLLLTLFSACDDSELVRRVEPAIEIQSDLLTGPSASRQVMDLHSTYPWFAEASDSWIKLQRYRGQALKPDSIVAEIEENPEWETREGWIEVRLMDQMSTRIAVKQGGRGSLITLSKKLICFTKNGGEVILEVVTDLEWNTDVQEADGFIFTKVDKNHLKVKAAKNTTGSDISKVVTLADTENTTKTELTVIQYNVDNLLSITLPEPEKDVLLPKDGRSMEIPVSLNVSYECVASDDNWIKIGKCPSFSGDIVQDITIPFEVSVNTGDEERNGYVVVKNAGATVEVSDTIYISQRAFGQIVYVKAGTVGGDGSSWERAFATVEEGIAACTDYGDMELWIAEGDYQLKTWTYLKKVNNYGGFKGTESKLKERDLSRKTTLIAAPNNVWNSVYANILEAGKCRYVDGFVFTGSNVTQGEGTIAVWNGWIFRNNIITGNTAYKNAGGYFEGAKIINCLIYDNCTTGSSSTIAALNTDLYNVTVVNNRGASGAGVGIRLSGSKQVVYNSVVWGNYSDKTSVQCYVDTQGSSTLVNTAMEGTFYNEPAKENFIVLGADNLGADGPKFVNPSSNDYRLQSTSPLIDAGNNQALDGLNLLRDIFGNKRIWGDKVDIGALEYFIKD